MLAVAGVWIATEGVLLQPLSVAARNPTELGASLGAIAVELLAPWAICAAGCVIMIQLLALVSPVRTLAFAVAFVVAQWLQGHWLVWDYGVFDGSPIDWHATPLRAAADLAVWGSLAAFAIGRPTVIGRRSGAVLFAVAMLEVVTFVAVWGQREQPEPSPIEADPPAAPDPTGFSRFSRAGDAILIVLDTLPPDVFAEALEEPMVLEAVPPGLTLFPDALAHHVFTDLSTQTLLTGEPISQATRGNALKSWIRGRVNGSPLAAFARAGGDAQIATFHPGSLACSMSTDLPCTRLRDWERGRVAVSRAREDANAMLRVGWFRASPQPLKALLYRDGRWTVAPLELGLPDGRDRVAHEKTRDDLAVLAAVRDAATADAGPARFRMLHLFGTHQPPTADARCEWRSSEPRREATVETARCLLLRVFALIDRLDTLGVYDPATVVLASDHGHPSLPVDPSRFGKPALPEPSSASSSADKIDWAVPMLLAKAPGERHELRISDRPVALCDVATTLADALGVDHELPCPSLFGAMSEERTRRHFRRGSWADGTRGNYSRYQVGSPAWDPAAWSREE